MKFTRWVACLAAALSVPIGPLIAQRPAPAATQRQVDSLALQLRRVQARLDSVLGVLVRLQRAGRPRADTALAAARAESVSTQNDLASLRAAAAAAAGRTDTTARAPEQTQFVGRERNQNQLNPEISVTGDVRAYGTTSGAQRDNFDPREFEVGFQSALDPYSHTKIFISLDNGSVSVEEGYAYWTGLPGHIRFDIGKFRQQFGELNRWHLHAVPETEYPLALRTYLGADGLAGTGISLYHAFGGLGTHELTAQVTRSESDSALFGNGGRPTYLVHLLNFWQLTPSTYLQIGGTGLYGTNPSSALRTKVGGLEFRFTWRPPQRALYRNITLRGELYALRKDSASVSGQTHVGWYVGSTYKLDERWIVGVRYDYVEDPVTSLITRQVIPTLTLWESEWVELRAQYMWSKLAGASATNQFALQAVWAIGPHKHETY